MKKRILILFGLYIFTFTNPSYSQTRELGGVGEMLDGVIAIVDEGVVLRSELNNRIDIVIENIKLSQESLPPEQIAPMPPLSILEEQVLEQLILQEIQLQRAERFGIRVNDEMVNLTLSSFAEDLGLSLDSLPEALLLQGINYNAYREETRQRMIIEQLQQRDVFARIIVSPREIGLCLQKSSVSLAEETDYNVSQILISLPSNPSQADMTNAQNKIDEIYKSIEDGIDFSQLAITYSDGQNALDGGSLGWRKGSQLPTLFNEDVINMEEEEYSQPIQSASGFHIVKLNEARGVTEVIIDQIRARHILIQPNEILDDDATQQKITEIRNQIINGDDFSTLAQALSEDNASAAEGGDLGWVEPGIFVPEFDEQLNQLNHNEISQPFKTRYGWHIVEITDTRRYNNTEELKERSCVDQIRGSKAEEELELWLRRIRDEAFVDNKI
ncbi:MAG: hypothetical protein CBC38_04015 [Gammaproteobacteria bacterium TMED78]|nr:MAG: hypothetical protein CBC38_04015 [Gammaproteobacteria bacterium TMED78]